MELAHMLTEADKSKSIACIFIFELIGWQAAIELRSVNILVQR